MHTLSLMPKEPYSNALTPESSAYHYNLGTRTSKLNILLLMVITISMGMNGEVMIDHETQNSKPRTSPISTRRVNVPKLANIQRNLKLVQCRT